ncbi:MAG: ABC transporter substrate-binding protein, partial [Promethearchaeota archaeon]
MQTRSNAIAFASLILLASVALISVTGATALDTELRGPYVDGVTYKIITAEDQRVLALLSEEIDMIDTVIDPVYIPQLEAAANIEIDEWLRNGYGHFTINCDSYPLNETALRRAFSFALNKESVCSDTFNGLASPLDSPLSLANPWSIEGDLPYNYYSAHVATGNALLTAAGFLDIDADGFREAPDGSDFQITVEVTTGSPVAADCGSA